MATTSTDISRLTLFLFMFLTMQDDPQKISKKLVIFVENGLCEIEV